MMEPQGHGEIDPNTGEWKITKTWTEFNGLDPEPDQVVAFKRHIQESLAFEKCQKDLLWKFTTGIKRLPRARSLRLHCGFDRWKKSNSDDLSSQHRPASPLARTRPRKHHFDPFIDPHPQNISIIKSYYFDFAMASITDSRGKLDTLDLSPNQTPCRALIYLHGMNFSAGRIAFESLTSLRLNTEIYDASDLASERGFVHLLMAARSLKRLDMSVRLCRVFRSRSVFSSDDDDLAPLFRKHTIQPLEELRLASFTTTTETLFRILGRHRKTLKRLHLQKITEIEDNGNWVPEVLEFCKTYLKLDAVRIDYLLRDSARDNRRVQVYETDRTAGWGDWDDVAETG
ncbi:hypothetical protein BKA61DRAFT_574503 [Leptodontidium sp. MPI-SDFR-AT-0119]|nr:hypothetical protein BKA61DRAFT_574503 [Leptodontidium sp. MPI-SDFR-AT-0119]